MDEIITTTNEHGTKSWYLNDKLHRIDGPAVEFFGGTKSWYLNGKLHRVDGPAIEWANGNKFWFLNGIEILEKDFIPKKKSQQLFLFEDE